MSDLPTYPLPPPPPQEESIIDSLSLQGEKLRAVLARLGAEVTGGLEEQDRALARVTNALKRRIQSSLRGQVKLLVPVMDAIHGHIAGSLAAQQVALATLMDQPGPMICPPGYYLPAGGTQCLPIAPGMAPGGTAPVAPAAGTSPAGASGQIPPTLTPQGTWGCPAGYTLMIWPDLHLSCVPNDQVGAATAQGAVAAGANVPANAPPTLPSATAPDEPLPGQYPLPSDGVPFTLPGGTGGPSPAFPPGTAPGQPQPQETPPPSLSDWPMLPFLPDWGSLSVCDTLDLVTKEASAVFAEDTLANVLLGNKGEGGVGSTSWFQWLLGGAAGTVLKAFTVPAKAATEWTDRALRLAFTGPDCTPGPVQNVILVRALAGFVEQWAGVGLDPLIHKLDYWVNSYCPSILPTASDANACYLAGTVDVDLWRCWVRANGACDDPQRMVVEASRTRPSVEDEYRVWLRGQQSEGQLLDRLRGLGILHPEDEARFRVLQQQIPTPSELIQWVVRESFDLDVVQRWGYDAERPDVAAPFFQAQGLTGTYQRVGKKTGQTDVTDHLGMTWAAHWIPLSPGQAYEIHHRVREDTVGDLQALGLNVKPFTISDVQSWLKIADYPEGVRDYLIATAYQPLRLIDIRNALILGVRDKQWVYRQFLSRGHSPQDAQFSADLAEKQAEMKALGPVVALERKALTWLVAEVQDSYELGTIDRASAANVLVQAGLSEPAASAALDARDARARRKLVARAVSSVRRDYLSGALSALEAGQSLYDAGIDQPQRERYLDLWSIELGHARRVVSTQKTVEWLTEGLITVDDAVRRLANLGWSNADAMVYLAEAQLKVAKIQAQRMKAAQTSERARAKELERLQKAAQAQADKARAQLTKLTPVSKLAKWFTLGYVTEPFIRQRMAAMGYNLESIELHLEEFRRAKADADAAKNGQAQGK